MSYDATVAPLAAALGVQVDLSCSLFDIYCVVDIVKRYEGGWGNILICWDAELIGPIAVELGNPSPAVHFPVSR